MPDPTPPPDFEHLHRDGLRNLELERARLAAPDGSPVLAAIDIELGATLDGIKERLRAPGRLDPESVFRAAIGALDDVESKRFMIENMLEALKRGESPGAVAARFHSLGLVSAAPPTAAANEQATQQVWFGLLNRQSLWKRVGLTVQQMAVNAVKSVPRWVEIEPSIGLAGPIPILTFALKGKGMSVYELVEILKGEGA